MPTAQLQLAALAAAALWFAGATCELPAQPPPAARDFNPRVVLRKPLPAIENAPFIRADQVREQVADKELVLGVVVAGQARAYPINMLTGPRREIINDTLADRPIAATW